MKSYRHRHPWISALSLLLALVLLPLTACGRSSSGAEPRLKERALPLTNVDNARDLGGYTASDGRTVKYGVLLRTAGLTYATEEDIQTLKDDYHLSVIIDFRLKSEVGNAPDPRIEGVRYRNLSIMDPNEPHLAEYNSRVSELRQRGISVNAATQLCIGVDSGFFSDHMYVDFLSSDVGKAGYRQFFKELLSLPEGKALLFHCSQGKDRTGCGAMLILYALGADEETVLEDYLLTNTFNADRIAEEREYLEECGVTGEELELCMLGLNQVNAAVMETALSWMEENYGSPLGYITEALGVTEAEIGTLREKFLEA